MAFVPDPFFGPTIDVTLNGSNSSLGTLDLEVTKSDGSNSLMHPYAFSGTFDQTLTDVVVDPGWNLIHLSAANFYGYSGYAEASMEVDVNPDNTDITLSQDPYTAGLDAQITITYTRDGQVTTDTLKEDPNQPELWGNTLGSIIIDTSRAGGGNETLHVTDTTRKIDDDIVFTRDTSGIMHGTFVPDPDTQDDYRNMSVTTGGVTGVTASTGGTLDGILLEVVGPTQLENLFHQITVNDLDFKIVAYQDKNFLQPWESNLAMPGVDLAMLDTSPSPNPVLASLNNPRRDGLSNFAKGFGTGVMDAGVSLWDGAKSMGKAVWNAMPPVMIYHLFNGQIVKQVRQGMQNLKAIAGVAEVLYQAVKQNSQQVILDMMLGNNTTINALGEQYTKVFEAGEVLQQVGNWFDNLDDYTFGKIEGRIVGEALVLVLTEGAGEIAELSKAALLQKLLPRLIKVDDLAPVAAKVTEATEEIIQYSNTTKMCFVAGTLVHTDNGLKPIETLKVGDQVFSKNEATGEQAYKQVVQTIVTHPGSLYHVHYANEIGSREILICTGEHPFYVKTRAGFVPAKDLRASDLLVTAEGQVAEVRAVLIEEGLGGTFTTYNLEVADFHTYFVGQAGAWVHNSAGGLCQEVAAEYRLAAKTRDPWSAFVWVLQHSPEKINAALGDAVAEVMGDCYKLAAKTGDYSKVPSVAEVREVMTGRLRASNLETHHTVPKYVQRLLGLNPAIVDDCPALILTDGIHQNQSGSFHSILEKLIPEDTEAMSKSDILKNLKKAYMDFGAPNAWSVVQNWLSKI